MAELQLVLNEPSEVFRGLSYVPPHTHYHGLTDRDRQTEPKVDIIWVDGTKESMTRRETCDSFAMSCSATVYLHTRLNIFAVTWSFHLGAPVRQHFGGDSGFITSFIFHCAPKLLCERLHFSS